MFKCGFTFCVTESLKKTETWDAMHIEKQTFITWLLTMAIIKISSSINARILNVLGLYLVGI